MTFPMANYVSMNSFGGGEKDMRKGHGDARPEGFNLEKSFLTGVS